MWFLPVGEIWFMHTEVGNGLIWNFPLDLWDASSLKRSDELHRQNPLWSSSHYRYDCTHWYEEEETQTPQRLFYLKTYEWVFLENTMCTTNEQTQRSRHSASILTLTLPCHQYSDRTDFCPAWCSQIILQQQHSPCSLHVEYSLGQLCTRGWCSIKGCQGAAPVPSVFPSIMPYLAISALQYITVNQCWSIFCVQRDK